MRRQANGDIRLEIHDDEDLCQDFLGSQSDIEDSEDMNLLDDNDTEYASQPLVQSKCKAKFKSNLVSYTFSITHYSLGTNVLVLT